MPKPRREACFEPSIVPLAYDTSVGDQQGSVVTNTGDSNGLWYPNRHPLLGVSPPGAPITGVAQLQKILRRVSRNGIRACFAPKMDVQRFFDFVDHGILESPLCNRVQDHRVLAIADRIIDSFAGTPSNRGLPLGNMTSQIFANVYRHPLDHFIKHTLHQKYHLRYCDDKVIITVDEKSPLAALIEPMRNFLVQRLRLTLHPQKIILSNMHQGIDFLGYILFLHHRPLHTSTIRRMQRRLKTKYEAYLKQEIAPTHMDQCLPSYLGILSHANVHNLSQSLKNTYWSREPD